MVQSPDSPVRIDLYKLEGDLRDAYTELLSAQFTIDRLRLRYSPQDVATNGGSYLVSRAIAAAEAIHEFLLEVARFMPPKKLSPSATGNKGS
jgi:hypothetical protein